MKTILSIPIFVISFLIISCSHEPGNDNILLNDFDTPHETVPFEDIEVGDYLPAIHIAIEKASHELDVITNNHDEPDFFNTIEALDNIGIQVNRIALILDNMISANTSDTLQKIAQEVFPLQTEFMNDIYLNEELFERVKSVYQKKDQYDFIPEQKMLLEKTYKDFIRKGANLSGEDKSEYRRITGELARLHLTFGDNVRKETNAYQLHITNEEDLEGLPHHAVEAAAQKASSRDLEGWVFTLQSPSYRPIFKYAKNRELRENIFKARFSLASHGNDNDNCEVIRRIVNLRLRLANILGYETYADYVLEMRMAENAENVNEFLDELLATSMPFAKKEINELQEYANNEGAYFQLMKWDEEFYAEKLRKKKYNYDSEMTRPYFELDQVQTGIFKLANTLYGISFKENNNIQVYHPDVKAYEVFDADGSLLAVVYLDLFPRENKGAGAWQTDFREQYKNKNKNIRPHLNMVFNFTEPTENQPSLLTIDEVNTFLHEFGHALHGIFLNCTYRGTGGLNVYRDFVELPSQIMENWVIQKEWLNDIAINYVSGESIPNTLLANYLESINFHSGSRCCEQIMLALLDMAWHSISSPLVTSVKEFEKEAIASTELFDLYRDGLLSTWFGHIFEGDYYAAGYYGYKWAEVLDADAFSLFMENGIFDKATAQSFRENILSKGAAEHPLELYKKFRGREPRIDALLERSGLVNDDSSLQ